MVISQNGLQCPVHHTHTDVITNCSHLQLTSLPDFMHTDTTWLDLSQNQLTSLQELSIAHLPKLRHLDVSHSSVRELDQQTLSGLATLHSVDLSHNQLTVISDRAFVHLTALTSLKLDHNGLKDSVTAEVFLGLSHLSHLDLSHNLLHVLHNATFSHLPELTWLSLQSNRLYKLQAGAMLGLTNLTSLDLTYNQLRMTSQSLPAGVFGSLSSLCVLRLHNNDDSHDGQYPPDVFNGLVSLRYLALDTFSAVYFGPDFAALGQIEQLDLTYNCKITHLSNDSFEGFKFSSLRIISFFACKYVMEIERCSFCNLPNLKSLRIEHFHILSASSALKALYGLRGQNMTELFFANIGDWGMHTYVIDKEAAESLSDICVQSFTMRSSRLRVITVRSIPVQTSLFVKCLENGDISDNVLQGDFRLFVFGLKYFQRLRTMQMQNQQIFSIETASCVLRNKCPDHVFPQKPSLWFLNTTIIVPTPPELLVANMSALFKHLNPLPPRIRFQPGQKLQTLDLSYNVLANCKTSIFGLDHLQTLKLNFNYCYTVSNSSLDNLGNLRHLELSNFGATTSFYVNQGKRLFHNLNQLETLDLSFNDLDRLDPTMLERQPRLISLDLSRNRFQSVPVQLGYHSNLTLLDLSRNNIPSLTAGERDVLDRLATRHTIRYQWASV